MKKLFAALFCATLLYSCTEAGEGSEVKGDSTDTGKDTITQMSNGGSATTKDTSSYERAPATQLGDSTRH